MTSYKSVLYSSIAIVCGFICVFLLGILNVYSSFLKSISVIGYVSFYSEKVDTMYSLLGKKKVCNYSSYIESGKERYEIDYCSDELNSDDFVKYSAYLLQEGFVLTVDEKGNSWYVKESVDNKVIGVYIDEYNSFIVYQKVDGYLYEDNDEKSNDSKYL